MKFAVYVQLKHIHVYKYRLAEVREGNTTCCLSHYFPLQASHMGPVTFLSPSFNDFVCSLVTTNQ